MQSDSRSYLASLAQPLHFALLDSANDSDLIFDEFRLVLPHIVVGGIVMVDDAGSRPGLHESAPASSAVKGRRVWQLLDSAGADYRLLRTPRGHGRQLKVVLDPSNRQKILDVLEVQGSCA